MNGFKRVALYARVSSQKQADEMTILSQRQAIVDRIAEDGMKLEPSFEFCDDGYSGVGLFRPALEKLRDQIATSIIDCVYVLAPDRLARKFAHQAILLEEFSKHQCEVVFVNQKDMPESPETNLLIQMQGMIAEYEREKILERTRRGRRYAATMGRMSVLCKAPYGYRYISKVAGDGEARWEVDPLQSQTVKLIFELVGQQRKSLSAVARELKSRGILTATGKTNWDRSTIRGMLLNPAYYGQAKYGKERLVPRKPGKRAKRGDPAIPRRPKVAVATDPSEQVAISVPAIINKPLFDQVKQQMEDNRKRQPYCARVQGQGRYRYYRCLRTDTHRQNQQAPCINGSVKANELESRVWLEVCDLLRHPSRLSDELSRRQQDPSGGDDAFEKLQGKVTELRGRLDRLIDGYTNGLIDKPEFEKRIHPIRARHDREVSALASLRGQLDEGSDWEQMTQGLEQLASQVESNLSTASEDLKRNLIKLLIKQVEIHPQEIRIVYRIPDRPFSQGHKSGPILQHCWRRHVLAMDASPWNPIRNRTLNRKAMA
jgi:site-specific DNA recombinase